MNPPRNAPSTSRRPGRATSAAAGRASVRRRAWRWAAPLALLLASHCGCTALPTDKLNFWSEKNKIQESEFAAPVRMAVLWSDAVLNQPNKPPTRGFGGRVYFYDELNRAIAVEGQLVVYAYDDTLQRPGNHPPDRKYAFSPQQFSKHHSKAELGDSYSIWLPWDAVGGPRKSVNLLPVFRSTRGNVVIGQQALATLPGPDEELAPPRVTRQAPRPAAEQANAPWAGPPPGAHALGNIAPVAALAPAAGQPMAAPIATHAEAWGGAPVAPSTPRATLRTTTIPIPRRTQRQLAQAAEIPAAGAVPAGAVPAAPFAPAWPGTHAQAAPPSNAAPYFGAQSHVGAGPYQGPPASVVDRPRRLAPTGGVTASIHDSASFDPAINGGVAPAVPPPGQGTPLPAPQSRFAPFSRPAPTWQRVPPTPVHGPWPPGPAAPRSHPTP